MGQRNSESWEDILAERLLATAERKEADRLVRVEDYNAHVIVAKTSGTPLAVVWTNQHGTHVMGISSNLNRTFKTKNYVLGKEYVEMLAQEVKKSDEEEKEKK